MEYLVFAAILYFILRTAGNLVQVLRGDKEERASRSTASSEEKWGGPSPREQTGTVRDRPTFWRDVDDATWEDLPD